MQPLPHPGNETTLDPAHSGRGTGPEPYGETALSSQAEPSFESELKIISAQLAAAAQADDLAATQKALEQRGAALQNLAARKLAQPVDAATAQDLLAAYESGELALTALADLKRHLQAEHARLAQVRAFSGLYASN